MKEMTCEEIYELIGNHTDEIHGINVFIGDWPRNGGDLLCENMKSEYFISLFGSRIPFDWWIDTYDERENVIVLSFLFEKI
jgi:phage gp46-like protein